MWSALRPERRAHVGPSLHSVNTQRALHKMNIKFQFGTILCEGN